MSKKIAIVGAGIAGLSAACYARLNGYEAAVYESHLLPGGLCTAWKRRGYTFDGCLHWLTGSAPDGSFHPLWEELGAVQGRRMIDQPVFYRFTGSDGRTLSLYADVDRLEAHLKELAPGDAPAIARFCGLVRRFTGFRMPMDKAFELFGPLDIARMMLKMLPYGRDFRFVSGTSIGEFAQRFRDPLLREVFPRLLSESGTALIALVSTLALLHNKAGGFPEGGSLEFARAIERRCLELGGEIHYGKRVEKIRVEGGKAVGLLLAGGEEVRADHVISAADLRSTLYELLDGRHVDPQHEELLKGVRLYPTSVQVSFGVDMDLSGAADAVGEGWKLETPIRAGGREHEWFFMRNFAFDPTLAPAGKSVVECTFQADHAWWEKLGADREAYRAEKERLAAAAAAELERRFPGFRSRVEATDVATPLTYVRYTGNWKGTYMTWVLTPETSRRYRLVKKTVPGLDNFWLSGMWVMPPGGVPVGAKTSRDVIQIICRRDGKRFAAPKPAPRPSAVPAAN